MAKQDDARKNRWALPRRLRPTREGWWFLAATLLLGLAAVNAGLNLLFAIFGMMLFLILASGVMSELCLRGLVVRRRIPRAVHAGAPYLMGISVENVKRRVPTFSLEVEDLTRDQPVERRCYFLKIPAGREQETAYRNVIARRGLHRLTGLRLSTRFPFGLIRKSRDIDEPLDLLVYPALVPVPMGLDSGAPAPRTAHSRKVPNRSGEFAGLRDYRPGDDARQVHWRSSAKRKRLLVRESEEESGAAVLIKLETQTVTAPSGHERHPGFENAVSLAASLALRLLSRGLQVGLRAGSTRVPPAADAGQASRILSALAVVEPGADDDGAAVAPHITVYQISPGVDAPVVSIGGGKPRGRAA